MDNKSEVEQEERVILLEQDDEGVLRADGKTPVHDFTDAMKGAAWSGTDFQLMAVDDNDRQHAIMTGIGEGLSNNDFLVVEFGDKDEQHILLWEIVDVVYNPVATLKWMANLIFVGIVDLPKAVK